ncbi:MAG: hypothetical protein NVSMB17_08840 [Candidatus Dormibacteria bacterium]
MAVNLRVLHATLASVTAAAGAALLVSGLFAAGRRSAPSIRLVLIVRRVGLIATLLAALGGGALFALGNQRPGGLHYLYAFFALAVIPLATTLAARHPRRGGLYHAGAGLLLLLMCLRLAFTGGAR